MQVPESNENQACGTVAFGTGEISRTMLVSWLF